MKKLVPIAISLALIAALLPGGAQGKKLRTKISLQIFGLIDPGGHVGYYFAGELFPQGLVFKCAAHRTVLLYRDENGTPDVQVGSARSDFIGDFHGPVQRSLTEVPGSYYARVQSKTVRKGGHKKGKLRCLAGRSTTLGVAAPQLPTPTP